jgi:hypothetical protein
MDGATLTFLNVASVVVLIVLFFVVLDAPVARQPKRNASANSDSHRKWIRILRRWRRLAFFIVLLSSHSKFVSNFYGLRFTLYLVAQKGGRINNRSGLAMSTLQNSVPDGSRHAAYFPHAVNHAPILVTVTGIKSNLWTVTSSDDSVGGLFVTRKAALAFAREAMVSSNAAVVVSDDPIMNDEQRFGRSTLDTRHRDASTPLQWPSVARAHHRSATASDPLFNEREMAIGFSLLTLAATIFASS